MERRKFLGSFPFAVGGALAISTTELHAQSQSSSTSNSVISFGAVGDGVTDDTAAFQAAAAYSVANGVIIYVPSGTYIVSSLISCTFGAAAVGFAGDGKYNSTIKTKNATSGIFKFNGSYAVLTGIGLTASVTQTGSALLTSTCGTEYFVDLKFDSYYVGFAAGGNVCILRDCDFSNACSTSSVGVLVDGYAGGLTIDNMVAYVPSTIPLAGIQVVSCGAVQISNSNIITQGACLLITPGANQVVASLNVVNTFFDSATYGVHIIPSTGGSVTRCSFTQVWTSSHSVNGFCIDGTQGLIDGVQLISSQVNSNHADGLLIMGANTSHIDVVGGEFTGNTGSGITLGSNASHIRIRDVFSGAGYGSSGNAFGMYINNTGVTNYSVMDSQFSGNTSGQLTDAANVGLIQNCIGFTSKNSGASTLAGSATSAVISHGLSAAPSYQNISISPTNAWGTTNLYVDPSSITATEFTVRSSSAPASGLNFNWRATCSGEI